MRFRSSTATTAIVSVLLAFLAAFFSVSASIANANLSRVIWDQVEYETRQPTTSEYLVAGSWTAAAILAALALGFAAFGLGPVASYFRSRLGACLTTAGLSLLVLWPLIGLYAICAAGTPFGFALELRRRRG
jgi:hypothetical protein